MTCRLAVAACLAAACSGGTPSPASDWNFVFANGPDFMQTRRPYVIAAEGTRPGLAFVDIRNGIVADTLRGIFVAGVTAPLRDAAGRALREVPIPPSQDVRLVPGGVHAEFALRGRTLARDDSVTMTMLLARRGRVPLLARTLVYADLGAPSAPKPED